MSYLLLFEVNIPKSNVFFIYYFRHHTYKKTDHKNVELTEVGPRFEMRCKYGWIYLHSLQMYSKANRAYKCSYRLTGVVQTVKCSFPIGRCPFRMNLCVSLFFLWGCHQCTVRGTDHLGGLPAHKSVKLHWEAGYVWYQHVFWLIQSQVDSFRSGINMSIEMRLKWPPVIGSPFQARYPNKTRTSVAETS